jgi:hypothetical protein
MSELALLTIAAEAEFDPVFTHLSLVLSLINFARSIGLLGLAMVIRWFESRDGGLCCADCTAIVGIKRLKRTKSALELHSVSRRTVGSL